MRADTPPDAANDDRQVSVVYERSDLPGVTPYTAGMPFERLYALRFSDSFVKIGVSSDVAKRFGTIRSEHARFGLPTSFSSAAFSVACFDAREHERALLDEFASSRVGGEYVSKSFDAVVRAMRVRTYRTTQTREEVEQDKLSEAFFHHLTGRDEGERRAKVDRSRAQRLIALIFDIEENADSEDAVRELVLEMKLLVGLARDITNTPEGLAFTASRSA